MRHVFDMYEVYYYDNDAQKKVVESKLNYQAAVKLCQKLLMIGIDASYKAIFSSSF